MESNNRLLFRYNLKILAGNTYWLIILPIVATQLVTFWQMALASFFKSENAARSVEILAPILCAFLCAHILSPEYRKGVGEVTFSRPFSVNRIVAMRLGALLVFLGILFFVMLVVLRSAVGEFDFLKVCWAGICSGLFLGILALTMATLFRSPLLGLAAAAVFWGLDLWAGIDLNPLLSLQTYSAKLASSVLAESWQINKLLLLLLAILLYTFNARLLKKSETTRTWGRSIETVFVLLAIILVYLWSGAIAKVMVGRRVESLDPRGARSWYQQQFKIYGPLPVPLLLGSDFVEYLGYSPSGMNTTISLLPGAEETEHLQRLLDKYPKSRWSTGALFNLAEHASRSDPEKAEILFRQVIRKDPNSPFAPVSLASLIELGKKQKNKVLIQSASEALLKQYPNNPEAISAGRELVMVSLQEHRLAEARKLADVLLATTTADNRPEALVVMAHVLTEEGKKDEARRSCQEALLLIEPMLSRDFSETSDTPLRSLMLQRRNLMKTQSLARKLLGMGRRH